MIADLKSSRLSWTHPEILAASVPLLLGAELLLATGPAGLLARTALRIGQSTWASADAFYAVLLAEAVDEPIAVVARAVTAVRQYLRANGLVSAERGAIRDYADAPNRTAVELAEVLRKVAADQAEATDA